jgi:hypothetical protein
MKITPLNEDNTLFMVENVYPSEIIAECQQQNIDDIQWESLGEGQYSQAHIPRRQLICNLPHVFARLGNYVRSYIPLIQNAVNRPIQIASTRVWADYPGYKIDRHIDNDSVYVTMQVYLNDTDAELGTSFCDNINGPYQHTIPYKANFGYLAVRTKNNYHGLTTPVPKNFIRLSSCSWFWK